MLNAIFSLEQSRVIPRRTEVNEARRKQDRIEDVVQKLGQIRQAYVCFTNTQPCSGRCSTVTDPTKYRLLYRHRSRKRVNI